MIDFFLSSVLLSMGYLYWLARKRHWAHIIVGLATMGFFLMHIAGWMFSSVWSFIGATAIFCIGTYVGVRLYGWLTVRGARWLR